MKSSCQIRGGSWTDGKNYIVLVSYYCLSFPSKKKGGMGNKIVSPACVVRVLLSAVGGYFQDFFYTGSGGVL